MRRRALLAALAVLTALATDAPAQDAAKSLTISLSELVADDPADAEIASEIGRAVADGLRKSGSLAVIGPPGASTKADARVEGRTVKRPDGRIDVQIRLWDAASRTMLIGHQYTVEPAQWRLVADAISDSIYERLIGAPLRSGEGDRK
jgi:TolB protein